MMCIACNDRAFAHEQLLLAKERCDLRKDLRRERVGFKQVAEVEGASGTASTLRSMPAKVRIAWRS